MAYEAHRSRAHYEPRGGLRRRVSMRPRRAANEFPVNGARGSVSVTRDMSGACGRTICPVLNRSKTGGEDEAGRAAARAATDEVRDGAGPLAARGAEPGGSGGDSGRDGTDASALVISATRRTASTGYWTGGW